MDGHGKTEVIKSIEASTYNIENGYLKKKALDQSAIYEERINDRWRAKKFVFPDVQDGSILEYRYILETPFHFNLPDWNFQDKIPTIYSKYEVGMIPFYEYIFLVQGISKFDYQNSEVSEKTRSWGNVAKSYGQNVGSGVEFKDYKHTYVLKDVPAFKDESYITSINDYLIKMDFQLSKFHSPYGGSTNIISTWPEMNKALLKHDNFGKFIKGCSRYAKKIFETDINLEGKTEKEKNKQIVNYVKSNFTWNGIYSKYASKSPKDLFTQKTGNSAEINLFLLSLFNHAGIDAYPVILSTRSHGKIKADYPFDHFFNYTIVFVTGEEAFLADGTESYLPYNRIPPRCINEKGLVVNEGDVNWVTLSNNLLSLENKQIKIKPNSKKLNSDVSVTINATEYDAYYYKVNHRNDTIALKKHFLETIGKTYDIKTFNYDQPQRPYVINFKTEKEIEKIGSNLVVSPFVNLALAENKLKQKERSYPVDLIFPNIETFNILVEIPQGYITNELPEPFSLNNELVSVLLNYQLDGNIIEINGSYSFKKSIYDTTEYAKLKAYIDIIVKRFNSQIVFKEI